MRPNGTPWASATEQLAAVIDMLDAHDRDDSHDRYVLIDRTDDNAWRLRVAVFSPTGRWIETEDEYAHKFFGTVVNGLYDAVQQREARDGR